MIESEHVVGDCRGDGQPPVSVNIDTCHVIGKISEELSCGVMGLASLGSVLLQDV